MPPTPVAQPPERSVVGTLDSIDLKAMQIVVTSPAGKQTLHLQTGVTIRQGAKTVKASELAAHKGERVKVRYRETAGVQQAEWIVLASPTPPHKPKHAEPERGRARAAARVPLTSPVGSDGVFDPLYSVRSPPAGARTVHHRPDREAALLMITPFHVLARGRALLVLVALTCCAGLNSQTYSFATLDEARRAGAIANGWVPEGLPPSSHDIRVAQVPKTSQHWGIINFRRSEESVLRGTVADRRSSARRRALRHAGQDRVVAGRAARRARRQPCRRYGLKAYRSKAGRTAVCGELEPGGRYGRT